MNRIFIFAVAVITLALTACGNKTQGGGDNDSLQTDSLQANDATKHTEEYIRQRIDTIYKYCGGKAVQIKGASLPQQGLINSARRLTAFAM